MLSATFLVECNQIRGCPKCLWILIVLHSLCFWTKNSKKAGPCQGCIGSCLCWCWLSLGFLHWIRCRLEWSSVTCPGFRRCTSELGEQGRYQKNTWVCALVGFQHFQEVWTLSHFFVVFAALAMFVTFPFARSDLLHAKKSHNICVWDHGIEAFRWIWCLLKKKQVQNHSQFFPVCWLYMFVFFRF